MDNSNVNQISTKTRVEMWQKINFQSLTSFSKSKESVSEYVFNWGSHYVCVCERERERKGGEIPRYKNVGFFWSLDYNPSLLMLRFWKP